MDNEVNELYRYLILSSYRDGDYILLDEYDELNEIIRRNDDVKYLEEVRYDYLRGIISEEEYNNICFNYVNELKLKKK